VLVILSQWLTTVLATTVVKNPGSFVKSLKVTAVKFISSSPTAFVVISAASMSVPRVALTMLLASMVIPVPAVYAVPLSNLHNQVFVPAS